MQLATHPGILALGIGNLLNSDEGVGVHAVRALQQRADFPDPRLQIVDGGTLGLNLLPLVEVCSHLLLLDCVDAGAPPGTLIELDREQIPLYRGLKLSQHQTTFQEVLGLAAVRDALPQQIRLIGIQPASLALGTELSPAVQATLPGMLARAETVLSVWLAETAVVALE